MLSLTAQDVKTGVPLADKAAVIQALADWLEQDGHVAAGYGAGMLAREAQTATYLGQGIAIPHCTQESRHLIRKTGIKAMHLPDGVPWGDGEKAYLVLGIAAGSDEHLGLLKQLARTLSRDGLIEQVKAAREPQQVLQLLQVDAGSTPDGTLNAGQVSVKSAADSLDQLVAQAISLIQPSPVEGETLRQGDAVHIGQGWWLKQAPAEGKPGAALLTTAGSAIMHRQQPVSGLLALAVKGTGHKTLLTQLTEWLAAGKGAELAGQDTAEALLDALTRGPVSSATHEITAVVRNEHGLHARPGAALVQTAKTFAADIQVRNLDGDGHWVSAKSLMMVIGLGAKAGHQLAFSAEGQDAQAALNALEQAVNEGLGEDVAALAAVPARETAEIHEPREISPNTRVTGVSASPGLAIGPVFVDAPVPFDYPQQGGDARVEQQKLTTAIEQASAELGATLSRIRDPQARDMMSMHRELLADPSLTQGVNDRIKQGLSAAAAWWNEIDSAATRQAASPDALLAERAADIRDIGRRVMARLCDSKPVATPEHPYLWVAQDIGPSQLVNLDPARVLGLVTVGGGASSHSAILARSLGIPALVAAGGAVMALQSGTEAILNGDDGTLWVAPEASVLKRARVRQQEEREQAEQAWAHRHEPAITRDGHRVEVAANLGDTARAAEVVEAGAEGVGLLRTEFVFMARHSAPELDDQLAAYKTVFDALDGRPLVARTLDVGGDKPLPYWPVPKEDNPFLGVRGIRLCMQRPELLETQLRALLMAAGDRPLRIMFPMVADWSEWRWAKALFDRILAEVQAADVQATDVQLGIMVEVPSVALNAEVFAREVDFFSIGTNDLTQYTLAMDRGSGELASLSDGLNPAVLRLIKMTVDAAHANGKWVGVCGELGSDPVALPLLVGLGVDELSVSLKRVPQVKAQLREWRLSNCRQLAEQALQAADAPAVRQLIGEAR
ncbi:phosphocarrier protein FPr [Oceanisphaera litoralis]|uniref:phosphoenolpyruvate--protein phosphotransferase n=1 Tax=Oceanisphaera litoralis TaxID=225144 RepID=UPI001956FB97|nr:phosphoenolpyruvate--protein phosphotransferase [Oceanisphaera litoralis]MBM7455612.1 phosphocarrier protein FPr [Oceanisphaera litoralis]